MTDAVAAIIAANMFGLGLKEYDSENLV